MASEGTRRRGLQALLAACAVLALLVGASAVRAAVPKNGAIAFSGKRGPTRVIYSRAASGRGALGVIPTQGRAGDPVFSPPGRRIAFTRYGRGGAQLWVTYLDGVGLRQLTSGPLDGMAAWSPDGTQVTFARGHRGRRDIYRVTADGTLLRRLTRYHADDHSPSWSARNGIAFVRRLGHKDVIFVISPTGGRPNRITRVRDSTTTPAWSPTARTMALARGRSGRRDIYLVTANGRHWRRLTRVAGDDTEPVWSPDGSRIAFTHRRGRSRRLYLMKVHGKAIRRLPSRSRRVRRLTSAGSASRSPTWQLAGADPVVAAAGDIACEPASPYYNNGLGTPGYCRQRMTSDLLLRLDLSAVLALGDLQYEFGALADFEQSFDPAWGRLKPLIRPVPGNHEYETSPATGYFDYFNGPGAETGQASDRRAGYYSYDIGSWHVVALNSECRNIGGCGPSSPQVRWLRSDLAAHPATCTLAYWHRPHFTSNRYDDDGDTVPLWTLLYAAHAELILNGHEHFYERFAPQTPVGGPDPQSGIRQFTVGTGGRSHFGFRSVAPNSEVRDNHTTGVLTLALRDGRYDWRLLRAPTGSTADSGSQACH